MIHTPQFVKKRGWRAQLKVALLLFFKIYFQANLRANNEELRNRVEELTTELDSYRNIVASAEKEKVGLYAKYREII